MRRHAVVFVLLLAVQGCNRSGPAGPGDIHGRVRTLTLVSARNPEQPVSGARVVFAGREYFTTAQGVVSLPGADDRSQVQVWADGFVSPHKRFIPADTTVLLIPDDPQLPFSWLGQVYYENKDNTSLWRPRAGMVSVELSDELLANEHMPGAFARGVAVINEAQPHVKYFLAVRNAQIRMYLDPGDSFFAEHPNTWAFISIESSAGFTITSARVVWKYVTREGTNDHLLLWHAVAHELGHHTGMWGHPPDGIMGGQWGIQDFSGREKEAMTYAFYRDPGTKLRDDSTQILFSESTLKPQKSVGTILCGLDSPVR